ncbi:MAG: hypothetical protein ACLGGY_04735 [Gammaproteobacteria bacterium]
MRTSPTTSLLVAALVMLRHPCNRNRATAQLLLERAAEHSELSPAEREACLDLAEHLACERPHPILCACKQPVRRAPLPTRARHAAPSGSLRSRAATTGKDSSHEDRHPSA